MAANEIQVFSNSQFGEIRTVMGDDNEPRFCLADICKILKLRTDKVTARLVDAPPTRGIILDKLGRTQSVNFVNEDGLYDAIFESRKKEAKAFRKWVTSEVLPSIRKTGGYIATKADDTPEEIMARALLVAQKTMDSQKKRIAEQSVTIEQQTQRLEVQHKELEAAAPKVSYYDETLMSNETLTMTQAANAVGMSVHELTNRLICADIIYRQSGQILLKCPYCQWDLHKTRTNTYMRNDGTTGSSMYTVWTQRGMRFIHALKEHNFAVRETIADLRNGNQAAEAARQVVDMAV